MRLLVAHPSPDVYGSDLQLVETVRGVLARGWSVTVVLPSVGPLGPLLEEAGADVITLAFPVLRKSLLSAAGAACLARDLGTFFFRAGRLLRRLRPQRVLVNTVTIPWWVVAARAGRARVVCHVHEAEADQPGIVRLALALPLVLARRVVANSQTSRGVLVSALPALARRTVVIYNGVPSPRTPAVPRSRTAGDPVELVLVGRLSPRKGTDVALAALALLGVDGVAVRLRLCGSVFPGYEWFEEDLRRRAAQPDLCGRVDFLGYVADPSAVVAEADIVLAPSRVEPFGNVAVEAMLAQRPLVASRVQGLAEIARDGDTALLVAPDDPAALAAALRRLIDDPELAGALAARARADAEDRFGVDRFRREIAAEILDA